MKKVCSVCGNEEKREFFETNEFTKCMICGEAQVNYISEDGDEEEIVFVD